VRVRVRVRVGASHRSVIRERDIEGRYQKV
jgi:hypothetical protein